MKIGAKLKYKNLCIFTVNHICVGNKKTSILWAMTNFSHCLTYPLSPFFCWVFLFLVRSFCVASDFLIFSVLFGVIVCNKHKSVIRRCTAPLCYVISISCQCYWAIQQQTGTSFSRLTLYTLKCYQCLLRRRLFRAASLARWLLAPAVRRLWRRCLAFCKSRVSVTERFCNKQGHRVGPWK